MIIFNKPSFIDKLLFTKHLGVMIKAGIPLVEAMEILQSQTVNPAFRRMLGNILADVRNGQNLTKSLSKHSNVFDGLFQSLIEVGEESGSLEKSFEYLTIQLQKSYEFHRRVQSAMLYPMLIIVVALVMGAGVSMFVLPQMVNLFGSMNIELPVSTKILLGVANFMRDYGLIAVPSFIVAVILFSYLVRSRPIRPLWDRFILRLPVFGLFIRESETATICRNLGLMLKAGLPINKALTVIEQSTNNTVFQLYLKNISLAVNRGRGIGQELSSPQYVFFPLIVSRMIAVGEKTGRLSEMLTYLADFFEEEVDAMAKNFPVILEPILLTAIAAAVAFIALSIISPIYQFTSSIR